MGALAKVRAIQPDDATRDKMEATLAVGSGWKLYLKARPNQRILKGDAGHGKRLGPVLESPVDYSQRVEEDVLRVYRTRSELTVTRNISERPNMFPGLHFGLPANVPFSTACSITLPKVDKY